MEIVATGDAAALLGEVLGERFRITSLIGEGSMGAVYRAQDTRQRRDVAVKVLAQPFAADDRAVARFKREARAASQLRHECCVEILDYGVDGGLPYIVMELLVGQTLYALLGQRRRISQEQAVAVGVKVCQVLEVAHEHGIVHRDLKPENIMVLPSTPDEPVRIKVLDFGIAKLVTPLMGDDSQSWDTVSHRLTEPGRALGTPAFMAPEQVRGDAIDDRTDIYVVGILLYEMVTGCLPFDSDDPVKVLQAQLREQPVPPSAHVPNVHPEFERVILTCLEKSRAARWPTARMLRRALEKLLAQLIGVDPGSPAAGEQTGEADEDYQLTEPVNMRWLRERREVLQELARGSARGGQRPMVRARATAETRVVHELPELDEEENETDRMRTAQTRVRGSGAPPERSREPSVSRETGDTTVKRAAVPRATPPPSRPPRGTKETRVVEDQVVRSDGVARGGAAAKATAPLPAVSPKSSAKETDDIPTIEVYDDDGQDVEMLISTMVKPLSELDPDLAEKLGIEPAPPKAPPPVEPPRRAAAGTIIEEPDELVPVEDAPSEADDTLQQKRPSSAVPAPRPQLESAISLLPDEVDIIDGDGEGAEQPDATPGAPEELPLVGDYAPDGIPTETRDEPPDEEAELATMVQAPEDADAELATAIRAVADDAGPELATAVKAVEPPTAEDELETTVRAPEDAARDLELAIAARERAAALEDVDVQEEIATSVRDPDADAEVATAVRPQDGPAADEEDWEEAKPTQLMARSRLADGLPEHLQRALGVPPRGVEPTLDDPVAAVLGQPDRELPKLVETDSDIQPSIDLEAERAKRKVSPTAPLPQFEPPAGPPPAVTPSSGIPPEVQGFAPGEDDLEQLLKRMPRTRYPVLSTVLALLVMAAALAGIVWLLI